jgi:hypothetical protein
MNQSEALNEFGKLFVERCRDYTILWLDKVFSGNVRDKESLELSQRVASLDNVSRGVAYDVAREYIEETLHNVLWMIEGQEQIALTVTMEDGTMVDVARASDGLSGEVFGPQGWYARFSRYGARAVEM